MSSTESSSPSPPASPEASVQHEPPNLERLISFFVAAKRSLISGQYVQRAAEIVNDSRGLIAEIAALNARNTYARRGIDEQLDTLYAIRNGVVGIRDGAQAEFQSTIKTLDEANARLERTLETLRKTSVDAALQRRRDADVVPEADLALDQSGGTAPTDTSKKTLFEFIDANGHQELLAALHDLVDEFQAAEVDLQADMSRFDSILYLINEKLQANIIAGSGSDEVSRHRRTIYDKVSPPPSVTHLFRGIESHSIEIAHLMGSLTSHYDLSVTALKHTEGGGEAARKAIQQAEELSTKGAAAIEESLYRRTVPEPIDEVGRAEMLRVLEGDASQLEEVMGEMKEAMDVVEGNFETLCGMNDDVRQGNQALKEVVGLLKDMKMSLPNHLAAMNHFRESWSSIQRSIEYKVQDLLELMTFYTSFSKSYTRILQEVERRKIAEAQTEKLAMKVQKELDRLHELDQEARQDFVDEVNQFLPKDIWPGAVEGAVKWELKKGRGKGREW
ncbi:Autophagy protein Apg17 [Teratosphaeria destructans]|uniref:Autophagy-related protein 17 n=1 Tax=Teratosphaeria destructans TaxID=418781 RepID=A0A9W7VXS7_9PEZI|nr:Autophagy protein Apg17 [Teratosphaeria destructans]